MFKLINIEPTKFHVLGYNNGREDMLNEKENNSGSYQAPINSIHSIANQEDYVEGYLDGFNSSK